MKLKHTKVASLTVALVTFISLAGGVNGASILVLGDDQSEDSVVPHLTGLGHTDI